MLELPVNRRRRTVRGKATGGERGYHRPLGSTPGPCATHRRVFQPRAILPSHRPALPLPALPLTPTPSSLHLPIFLTRSPIFPPLPFPRHPTLFLCTLLIPSISVLLLLFFPLLRLCSFCFFLLQEDRRKRKSGSAGADGADEEEEGADEYSSKAARRRGLRPESSEEVEPTPPVAVTRGKRNKAAACYSAEDAGRSVLTPLRPGTAAALQTSPFGFSPAPGAPLASRKRASTTTSDSRVPSAPEAPTNPQALALTDRVAPQPSAVAAAPHGAASAKTTRKDDKDSLAVTHLTTWHFEVGVMARLHQLGYDRLSPCRPYRGSVIRVAPPVPSPFFLSLPPHRSSSSIIPSTLFLCRVCFLLHS